MELTIVIPVYNEASAIAQNVDAIQAQLAADGIAAALILVDDGSRDDSWKVIQMLAVGRDNITSLRLSRNFGKEAAIFAGIKQVQTQYCLVMDADLQHPPRYIKDFLQTAKDTNIDIVEGIKADRGKESLRYKLLAKLFYRILRTVSGVDLANSSDFKLLNRRVMDVINSFDEKRVFFRGLVGWSGFERAQIEFMVDERSGGETKFSTRKLLGMAVNSMLSYTGKPIYLTLFFSVLFGIGAMILGVHTLYNYFAGHAVSGFSTVILLLLTIGALILFSLCIIGAYIARIYDEVKNRPQYIISETTRKED
ncbi:MAG: glycosyltransferase family 2 protein [Oscillospiraceae bacterium]|nr:glycosyltransferase family 2 protein [Oscillospiraceae bacterium]